MIMSVLFLIGLFLMSIAAAWLTIELLLVAAFLLLLGVAWLITELLNAAFGL